MPRGESKSSPRRIVATKKQAQALELRMAGRTFQEIADTIGYQTPQGAIMAVKAALDKTIRPAADEWRALTLERLTKILQVFWPKMLKGDEKAADRVFKAITDHRQLLGLDAPVKTALTDSDGGPITFIMEVVKGEKGETDE